jgi:hypothetical protein
MAVPARPASGAPIDSAWGGVAHDTAVAQDIQAGSASVGTGSAGAVGPGVVVTFPRPFAAPPTVVVSGSTTTALYIANAAGISATGMTLFAARRDSGNTTTAPVHWVAVGPRA